MARPRRKATLTLPPNLAREVESSPLVRDHLRVVGEAVAGDMRELIKQAVAATRAAKLSAGERNPYLSTGNLAASISYQVSARGGRGYVLWIGSNADGRGASEVDYAATYFWGYDPTGPRGHYQWSGNDVFAQAFDRYGIRYRRT